MDIVCRKPFRKGLISFPCCQCMPCRHRSKKVWQHRLILESFCHADNAFVTATYEDLPPGGSLSIRDYQLWLGRLRKDVGPFRYFLVGEYGDEGMRPHYHAALFGISPLHAERLQQAWDLGFVYTGDLTVASAAYVAGYVTKKLTTKDGPHNFEFRRSRGILLGTRIPEFARMSLKPGIGATAVPTIGLSLTTDQGADLILATGDVPRSLKMENRSMALGRYMRRRLREELGFKETGGQEGWLLRATQELCALQEDYERSTSGKKNYFTYQAEVRKQKVANIEARLTTLNKGGLL